MSSQVTKIADAVVTELNAGTFSQPFTAERSYLPRFELTELVQLKVTVVPAGVEVLTSSRARTTERCTVDVGIQQKLPAPNPAEPNTEQERIDALIQLAQEVADSFRLKRLQAHPQAIWVKTEQQPLYDPQHLEQMRQFTGVVRLTYQVTR